MAKRRRWKDELKKTLLNDEDRPKKQPKIEVLEEVVYKDGVRLRSTSYRKKKFKCSSEQSHLPTTPQHSKPVQLSIQELTPTFRKPKSYMSETKRVIENIFSAHITQQQDKTNDDFVQNPTNLGSTLNTSKSDLVQNTSHETHNCLVNVDSDASLLSPETHSTENFTSDFEIALLNSNEMLCGVNASTDVLETKYFSPGGDQKASIDFSETKQSLPFTIEKSPNTAECTYQYQVPLKHKKSSCTAEYSSENKSCLSNTPLKSPCIVESAPENKCSSPNLHQKSSCTIENAPESKYYLPNIQLKSPCSAKDSHENIDCLLTIQQRSACDAEIPPENSDCLASPNFKSHDVTADGSHEKNNTFCLPTAQQTPLSTDEDFPKNEDCLPNTYSYLKSPHTAEGSPKNKNKCDCLPPIRQTSPDVADNSSNCRNCSLSIQVKSSRTAENVKDCLDTIQHKSNFIPKYSPKNTNCLPNTHRRSSYSNDNVSGKKDNVPDGDGKYLIVDSVIQVSSPIPSDTNIEANNSTNSPKSSEETSEKRNLRNCRKRLIFDKCYIDFFEEDDADTLLLNEAFPSEESSCSFDNNETSDDSVSSNTIKTRTNKKQEKKLKKKKDLNQNIKKKVEKTVKKTPKAINVNESQQEENQLITKSKQKKTIKKENKVKKAFGQTFVNEKGQEIPSRSMKPNPCKDVKCNRNCGDIPDTRRQELFNFYWSLGSCQRQRDWIAKSAIRKKTASHTTDKGESSRRKFSFEYYINEGEGRRQVCQKFLINTLDITQRFIVYTLDNASEGFAKLDERGKNGGSNRTSEDTINHAKKFISSLPLVPSHYCRKDSNKLYLPDDFKSWSNVYRIYETNCSEEGVKQMSFKVFSNWLKDNYNIGIHVPKKDKCMLCMTQTFDVKNYDEMSKYNDHITEKEESYKRFQCHQKLNDVDPSVICASFDMQKVLNTPHGDNMALYYCRKIAVYNLTVYESNTRIGICNIWTEIDARRGANEISTCIFNYLQEVDKRGNVKTVLLYCDSCYGQNKNKTMLSMLRYFLSIAINLEVIQINYLIPGHTYMPVDSMHSTIERAVKKTTVWAPSQWPTVVEMARKKPAPYRVSILEGKDFMGFEEIVSKTFKKNQKIQISKLCIVTFKKANPDIMFTKNSMLPNVETTSVSLCSLGNAQPKIALYSTQLPISIQKYKDLKKLVDKQIVPKRFAHEYLKLKHDKKIKDVLVESEEEEESRD